MLAGPLRRLDGALRSAKEALADGDSPWLVAPLADRVGAAARGGQRGRRRHRPGGRGVDALPLLLGESWGGPLPRAVRDGVGEPADRRARRCVRRDRLRRWRDDARAARERQRVERGRPRMHAHQTPTSCPSATARGDPTCTGSRSGPPWTCRRSPRRPSSSGRSRGAGPSTASCTSTAPASAPCSRSPDPSTSVSPPGGSPPRTPMSSSSRDPLRDVPAPERAGSVRGRCPRRGLRRPRRALAARAGELGEVLGPAAARDHLAVYSFEPDVAPFLRDLGHRRLASAHGGRATSSHCAGTTSDRTRPTLPASATSATTSPTTPPRDMSTPRCASSSTTERRHRGSRSSSSATTSVDREGTNLGPARAALPAGRRFGHGRRPPSDDEHQRGVRPLPPRRQRRDRAGRAPSVVEIQLAGEIEPSPTYRLRGAGAGGRDSRYPSGVRRRCRWMGGRCWTFQRRGAAISPGFLR